MTATLHTLATDEASTQIDCKSGGQHERAAQPKSVDIDLQMIPPPRMPRNVRFGCSFAQVFCKACQNGRQTDDFREMKLTWAVGLVSLAAAGSICVGAWYCISTSA